MDAFGGLRGPVWFSVLSFPAGNTLYPKQKYFSTVCVKKVCASRFASLSHVISRPQAQAATTRRFGERMLRATSVRKILARVQTRAIQSSARRRNENIDLGSVERVSDEVDVCIVGGGPAGLSAAIRLKQLEQEKGREVRVVVIEKGSEIGKHTLLWSCSISTPWPRFTHTFWRRYRTPCSERAHSELGG
jgi:Pyridine nucleotide-disulphide oxidoreductase